MSTAVSAERVSLTLIDGNIVATVQIDLVGEILRQFGADVLATIERTRARALLIDLSSIHVMDVRDFEALRGVAKMAALMGTRTILVGLRPGVAANLTELNAETSGLMTTRTVEHALAVLNAQAEDAS
ncbi:MAG: STAS domain-containing protein [Thalassobaculaceae bacterium]